MGDVQRLFERMARAVNVMKEGHDHNADEVARLRQQLQHMEQELEGMGHLRQQLQSTEEQLEKAEQHFQKETNSLRETHARALAKIEGAGENASTEASAAILSALEQAQVTISTLQESISRTNLQTLELQEKNRQVQLEIDGLKRTNVTQSDVIRVTQIANEKAESDLKQAQFDLQQEKSALQVAQGAREQAELALQQAQLEIGEQNQILAVAVAEATAPFNEQIASLKARLSEITQEDEANIRSLKEKLEQAYDTLAAHGAAAHHVSQRRPAAAAEETETASEKQDRLALERASARGGARRRR